MTLMVGLFFSAHNLYAEEISLADLNAAYDYYSNVSGTGTANTDSMRLGKTPRSTSPGGIGGVAVNLMQPVEVLSGFLSGMAIIIGLTCLFGAFIRYMQHRVNPLAHPIGMVITLLILGILLLLLPLMYKLTESGIPFSYG